MAQSDNIAAVKKISQDLRGLLSDHRSFVEKAYAKYEAASGGGVVNLVAAMIHREVEYLDPVLAERFDFETLSENRLTQSAKDDLRTHFALLEELAPFYATEGKHRKLLREELAGDHGLTRAEVAAVEGIAPKFRSIMADYTAALEAAGVFQDPAGGTTRRRPVATAATAWGGNDHTSKGDGAMPHDTDNNHSLVGIEDAISRLQGPGGFGTGQLGNVYNAFDSAIDQKLQLTLGVPSLNSDTALAMDPNDLTSKLFEGLNRTVAVSEYGGVSTYSFNPLLARGGLIGVEDFALGAQAVAAETIRSLKPVFMTNLHKLVSETVIGEQDEADDLRQAIEEGLDKLVIEAGSEMGVYTAWAREIIDTIARDLLTLADLYDIREPVALINMRRRTIRKFDYAKFSFSKYVSAPVEDILDEISFNPAKQRILAEPDIGILTAEANDRAFIALLSKLKLMADLILREVDLGPVLGRVRVLNDTIGSSVIAARSALIAAGVSESDQAVSYNTPGAGSIDLRRLLTWVETESVSARTVLLRMDLNPSDLRRLHSARATQLLALESIIDTQFPTVNNNRYAHGRRQLVEVRQHLRGLVDLLRTLIDESTDDTSNG